MALDQINVDEVESKDKQNEMSFLDHLEELRWHILRALAATSVIAIIVFLMKDFVFNTVIFGPKQPDFITYRLICGISDNLCFGPPDFQIITRELGEQFIVHLKVSFFLGLIVAFPYVFWEIWRFVSPGLYEKERKMTRGVVFVCSALFISGVMFGYFVISPFAVSFLSSYDVGATSAPTLASYVNYMTMFTLPTGLIFELPIVVYFLAKVGLVDAGMMRQYRRHAFVIILILSAIITPPDVITQLLITVPLYFLFEISILIAKRVYKEV